MCVYTSTEQKDDDAAELDPDMFIQGMSVNSKVHYDVPDVPYKPAVAVPFAECPESANPHSIVQEGNVIHLEGAPLSTTCSKFTVILWRMRHSI